MFRDLNIKNNLDSSCYNNNCTNLAEKVILGEITIGDSRIAFLEFNYERGPILTTLSILN